MLAFRTLTLVAFIFSTNAMADCASECAAAVSACAGAVKSAEGNSDTDSGVRSSYSVGDKVNGNAITQSQALVYSAKAYQTSSGQCRAQQKTCSGATCTSELTAALDALAACKTANESDDGSTGPSCDVAAAQKKVDDIKAAMAACNSSISASIADSNGRAAQLYTDFPKAKAAEKASAWNGQAVDPSKIKEKKPGAPATEDKPCAWLFCNFQKDKQPVAGKPASEKTCTNDWDCALEEEGLRKPAEEPKTCTGLFCPKSEKPSSFDTDQPADKAKPKFKDEDGNGTPDGFWCIGC